MMTCKQVSTLLSMEELETAPLARRMSVWMHLAMCRHCRAFRRQIFRIGEAARRLATTFGREPSASFEGKILNRLGA